MLKHAAQSDVGTIIEMMREMESESPLYSMDVKKTSESLPAMIESDTYLILIAEREDHPVGFFVGHLCEAWYNNDITFGDDMLYVRPDFRACGVAIDIMDFIVRTVKMRLQFGITAGINKSAKRLYSRYGFNEIGTVHRLENAVS